MAQRCDDFLEKGAVAEEAGDRWLASDVAKALRFYERAHAAYGEAAARGHGDPVDVAYNAARLELHVYQQYRGEGMARAAAVAPVALVLQPLALVVAHHEAAVELARGRAPYDLLYNLAQAYTLAVEELADNEAASVSDAVDLARRAYEAFLPVLHHQTALVHAFVEEVDALDAHSDADADEEDQAPPERREAAAEHVLQPPDVFDTVLACYRLAQAVLENISDPVPQISEVEQFLSPYLAECDTIASQLLQTFSEATNTRSAFLASVSEGQKNDYLVAKTAVAGLTRNSLDELAQLWAQDLPESPERYLVCSDNIQELLDRNGVNVALAKENADVADGFWKALTLMTNALKKAQELLAAQKASLSPHSTDGLGTLIATLSNIIIRRADIDLQRCQLDILEAAQKHKNVLFQNCKVFLKNAMNMANTSGGLREKASEKMLREHRKVEAVLRLCVLEGKTSVAELDEIVGRGVWTRELPLLAALDYFEPFGVKSIGVDGDE